MQSASCATQFRTAIAASLCLLLAASPILAESPLPTAPKRESRAEQKDDRVLHALNRLTFGPRPGEVAEVERIGLKRWFDQQLNPATINDVALSARLEKFPAMAMGQDELLRRYPSPQQLREIIRTGVPLPQDPIEHAVYADQIAFYEAVKAKQAETGKNKAAANMAATAPDSVTASGSMSESDGMAPAQATQSAPLRRGQARNLLGAAGDAYSMPRKAHPNGPAETAANIMSGDSPKSMGEQAAQQQPYNNFPEPGRGKPRHEEDLYPAAEVSRILALPPDNRVRELLALPPQQLLAFRRSLSQTELASLSDGLTPLQMETLASLQGSTRMISAELLQTRLERDVFSNRQIEAVMTDFWLNHFNVFLHKDGLEPFLLPAYERGIRMHSLGRFEDLLVAVARSPAMLIYLDNAQSIGPNSQVASRGPRIAAFLKNPKAKQALNGRGLNENYARELLELHTLGVRCESSKDHVPSDRSCGAGYTQADITDVARIFSGWTIDRPNQDAEYTFQPRRHDPGSKTVLGKTIPEGGEREGLELLHLLASSPATARFISTKLAVRFVSDTPPPALVDSMTRAYLKSHGDIRSVLHAMFDSREFWAPEIYRAKVKTPLEFVASTLRASDAQITNAVPLVQSLDRLGMPLYGMQTPNGYSWLAEPWVSTGALVARMNFAILLSGDHLPGAHVDWASQLGPAPPGQGITATPVSLTTSGVDPAIAARERHLETLLLGTPVSDRTRAAVLEQSANPALPVQAQHDFAGPGPATPNPSAAKPQPAPANLTPNLTIDRQSAIMAGLLFGSPEFQRR